VLAIGACYLLLAWLSSLTVNGSTMLAQIWLAAGLGPALLARNPRTEWPWIMLGLVLGDLVGGFLIDDVSALVVVCWTLGNVVEALVAGWLLVRLGAARLTGPADLMRMLIAVVPAVVAGSVFGALAASAVGADPRAGPATWLFGDFTGMIVTLPFFLRVGRRRSTPARHAEMAASIVVALVLALLVFSRSYQPSELGLAQILLVPLVAWIALRHGVAAVSAASAGVIVIGLAFTREGLGPFAGATALQGGPAAAGLMLVLLVLGVEAIGLVEDERRESTRAERRASQLVRGLVDHAPASVHVKAYEAGDGGVGRYVLVNEEYERVRGLPADEILGRTPADLDPPDVAARLVADDREVLRTGAPLEFETTGAGAHGSTVEHVVKFPVFDDDGGVAGVASMAIDVTHARRREHQWRMAFGESPVAMAMLSWRADGAGDVLRANAALAVLLGVPTDEVAGRPLDVWRDPGAPDVPLVVGSGTETRERALRRADGTRVWALVSVAVVDDDVPGEAFALVTLQDVTARHEAEARLTRQALHDPLTGLLNRHALVDRLEAAISRLWRHPKLVALLFCDLDGFKHLNDSLGHGFGDQVLAVVAQRFRSAVRPEDTVARLGGDEFVVVCEGLATEVEVRGLAERIRSVVHEPVLIDGREFILGVSIGVALTKDPRATADDLLRRADMAMYHAKDAGRDRVAFYLEELEQRAVAHLQVQEDLRSALAEHRLVPYFQPIVELATGTILGVEALARLIHPERGVLAPDVFIDVAESTGLVGALGEAVLDQALEEAVRWAGEGHDIGVAVNVSPRQLVHGGFARLVAERLERFGVDPQRLTLEVTERAVVDATGPTVLTLRRLRSLGIHVAIDDFGTGYSSLTSLRYLPADIVKVDRAFVSGITSSTEDAAIVSAVITVAHDLGRVVVAEGVETQEQATALAWLGCDQVQGYLYARPLPARDVQVDATAVGMAPLHLVRPPESLGRRPASS
jgi:diguanylate cyclase (GGDEF)-like protein/PAS domain S-box-containing protein